MCFKINGILGNSFLTVHSVHDLLFQMNDLTFAFCRVNSRFIFLFKSERV